MSRTMSIESFDLRFLQTLGNVTEAQVKAALMLPAEGRLQEPLIEGHDEVATAVLTLVSYMRAFQLATSTELTVFAGEKKFSFRYEIEPTRFEINAGNSGEAHRRAAQLVAIQQELLRVLRITQIPAPKVQILVISKCAGGDLVVELPNHN